MTSHTDHPMRHWDRACPACNEVASMTEKPNALKLANLIDEKGEWFWCNGDYYTELPNQAAAELRRLHEVNQALLEALKNTVLIFTPAAKDCTSANVIDKAKVAIAKAEGDKK